MSRLRVAPIVEGHGEVQSVPILLDRLWRWLGGEFIDVARPIRGKSGRMVKNEGIEKYIQFAVKNLNDLRATVDPALVLILIDAEKDCPAELGPRLLGFARKSNSSVDVACVVVNVEYETWFVAAAESLSKYLDLSSYSPASESPESSRNGKGWVKQRFRGATYSEPRDQPAMTHAMDLSLCRDRSPSFRKLCRELDQGMRRPD